MVALGTVIQLAAPVIGLLTSPFALIAARSRRLSQDWGVRHGLGVEVVDQRWGAGLASSYGTQDAGIGEALLRASD